MAPGRLTTHRLHRLLIAGLALLAGGCDDSPQFAQDELLLVDRQIVPAHREQIAGLMSELFGNADEPRVPSPLRGVLDAELLTQAAGRVESHEPGVTRGLYRRHCARCHGVSGDGAGPTALYQHPYPRDFRAGVFKFKWTERGAPPTDADLHAVLLNGVPGTAMPSFVLLRPEERDSLVAQVKYLAIRGRVERALIDYVAEELDYDPKTGEVEEGSALALADKQTQAVVVEVLEDLAERWSDADARIVAATPPAGLDSQEWIEQGRQLFHDAKRANCAKCHGEDGSGGVALKEYDDWDKRRVGFLRATEAIELRADTLRKNFGQTFSQMPEPQRSELQRLLKNLAQRKSLQAGFLTPRVAVARTLAGGKLRGGETPEDLFRRLHEGIAGTPMPGVGDALSDEEVWKLVAYVRSLVELEAPPPAEAIAQQ